MANRKQVYPLEGEAMASDVEELQKTLDRILRIASQAHFGASDRKRTLQTIRDMIEERLTHSQ